MDEAAAEEALRQFGNQSGLVGLFEEYLWLGIVLFALLFMKGSIENLIAGLAVSIGSDYQENATCWIQINGNRRPARIAQMGLLSTTFYLYDVIEDDEGNTTISGGTLMRTPNSELKSLRIERPLDRLPFPAKSERRKSSED
jgi:hypothetical protein